MSVPGYVLGRCSACGGQAKKSPVSARWWHLVPVCSQTSILVFQPVQRYKGRTLGPSYWPVLGPTDVTERPARFVEDAP